jgi:hypothetical protein
MDYSKYQKKGVIPGMKPLNTELFEKIFLMTKTDIERTYEYLGEGAGRNVYAINKRYVIKLSKSEGGEKQCEMEDYIFKNAPRNLKKCLCPVVWYKEDMVIMRRAIPLVKNKEDKHKNIFRLLGIGVDDPFYKKVNKLVDIYDLLFGDVKSLSSWGLLDGQLVLIDYGCTYDIYKKYFD